MKFVALASGALVLLAACSSSTNQPPVDTTGSSHGAGGGAVSGPAASGDDDAGATSGDSGVIDASDASNSCVNGCLGCCDLATNTCQSGNLSSACGVQGSQCTVCPTGLTCTSGFCSSP